MAELTLELPDETLRSLKAHLSEKEGEGADVSAFVSDAVRREVFWRTVKDIQDRNTDLTEEEAMELANEAVAWARANPS